ncbi:MAG: FAD-binding oxidoreductase [Vulcanimicrobiaceae bacterium]
MNRRTFLGQASAFAVVASSGTRLACASILPWGALGKQLSGRLVLPGEDDFLALARPNNLRYALRQPRGIALCANAADVAASIRWATEHGVPLIARSGGHSYAGYSTTTGLMIDVARMHDFAFDSSTGIVTVGGGARNKHVYANCRKVGVAITHGRCAEVGIAGLSLGGGVGFNMRAHGVLCDQLVESEIVTADGSTRVTNPSKNPDLFWACRGGGGGNFGINTSMSFQTFDVGRVTAYDLSWVTDLERVFERLVAALETAPASLGCKVSITASPRTGGGVPNMRVELLGQFAGSSSELLEILHPVYAVRPPSNASFLKELPYWDAQDKLSELGSPAYFQERSRFLNDRFSHTAIDTIFGWLRRWPATTDSATFKAFQTGERINAVSREATAFAHRESHWLGSVDVIWNRKTAIDVLQRNLEWQSDFYDALIPIAKGGAYQNFADPSLSDWETAYYGANLPRLEAVKRRVDPARVFTFPEAIP